MLTGSGRLLWYPEDTKTPRIITKFIRASHITT